MSPREMKNYQDITLQFQGGIPLSFQGRFHTQHGIRSPRQWLASTLLVQIRGSLTWAFPPPPLPLSWELCPAAFLWSSSSFLFLSSSSFWLEIRKGEVGNNRLTESGLHFCEFLILWPNQICVEFTSIYWTSTVLQALLWKQKDELHGVLLLGRALPAVEENQHVCKHNRDHMSDLSTLHKCSLWLPPGFFSYTSEPRGPRIIIFSTRCALVPRFSTFHEEQNTGPAPASQLPQLLPPWHWFHVSPSLRFLSL